MTDFRHSQINFPSTFLLQTFCVHKAMLPGIAKVNLSVHDCYAYYATAANLDKLYPPVKILAPH